MSGDTQPSTPPGPLPGAQEKPAARKPRIGGFIFIAALVIAGAVVLGMLPRLRARHELVERSHELAVPTVTVVMPSVGKTIAGISYPAEVKPRIEAPIYARASGYLKRWLVDIGDTVKAGQILAEIDTPEVDQELAQARAQVAQNAAALELSKVTAARWTQMRKTAAVSDQETQEKTSDLALKTATAEASKANLRRLEDLKGFATVTAPFDGTITARTTDVGQLIAAANGRELFRLADTHTLRVFVRVPQTLSRAIAVGQNAELSLAELPGRKFPAKIVRTAGAMDPSSRTLLCELEVDNARGEILSGSYAQVSLTEAKIETAMTLPSNTLLFRAEGVQIGVVGGNGVVELRSVKLGRDFGQTVEVLEGAAPSDRVILNPADSLTDGATVRPVDSSDAVVKK